MLGGRKVSALMLDLSGTVHIEDKLIDGVKEGISLLKSSGVPIQYVSNTSKESLSSLRNKIVRAGLDVEEEDIFTSLTAARDYVQSEGLRPMLLLEDSAAEEFSGIETVNPNSVVVGLSPSSFNYEKLNEAFSVGMF